MKKFLRFLLDVVEIVVCAFVISFIITRLLFMSCEVDGRSMQPTLQDGQVGFSSIISRKIKINRFDIVVIDQGEKLLVKRVIGMPNDEIVYEDNKLYINGELLEDEYGYGITNDFSIKLNDDEYFCLGDNREISRDSRYYGPFSGDKIMSTHLIVISPLSDFGFKK